MKIAAVVDALGKGLIPFQSPCPDTDILLANLNPTLLLGAQANKTGWLVVVLHSAAHVEGFVLNRTVSIGIPFFCGFLALEIKDVNFRLRDREQFLHTLAADPEPITMLSFKKTGVTLGRLGGGKRRIKPIVIAGRDGIEFVVVALGASQWRPEKGLPNVVHHIIKIVLPADNWRRHGGVLPWSHAKESLGHNHLRVLGIQVFPSHLFKNKPGIGFILIEGTDNVVAITPGVGSLEVVRETAGVSVTGDVQPVLTPTLSVMRAFQQTINQIHISLMRILLPCA